MSRLVLCVFLLAVTFQLTEQKVFTRCQLAKELLNKGFSRTFLSNWVCLVENESQRNSSAVIEKKDNTYSYGLFQINSKEWCKQGRRGGKCNVSCESLVDDNINDDVTCAQKIFDTNGFKHWPGWEKKCKNTQVRDVIQNCRI